VTAAPAATLLKGCVHAYRYTLRGIIGSHCRHYPSCSDYALEALDEHGALRGAGLTARRILRCNPWHPGGYDPVPPADTSFSRATLPDQVRPPVRDPAPAPKG
jgi:putative membrane protein insertion efficiency factor